MGSTLNGGSASSLALPNYNVRQSSAPRQAKQLNPTDLGGLKSCGSFL